MWLKSMAKTWPYRPDFMPTAALSVSNSTYLYQSCTWIIISIKFSSTTGRPNSLHKRGYTISVPLTVLKKKKKLNFMEVHHGKNSHLFFWVFQWNIRINSNKHSLPTTDKNHNCHSLLCPGLLVPDPFPCVNTHMDDQAFNHIGKLLMLKSWGEKAKPIQLHS